MTSSSSPIRDTSQRQEKRPIAIIISIILVSYTLFFYFQVSSEFRLKETLVNDASAQQQEDGSQLARIAEARLSSVASALQSASPKYGASGNTATSEFLHEIGRNAELANGMVLLVTDSSVVSSWAPSQEETSPPSDFDLAKPAASMLDRNPSGVAISSGHIDGVPFVYIARQLGDPEASLVIVAVHPSEFLVDLDGEQYGYYFADSEFNAIQSLGGEVEESLSESEETTGSFLDAVRAALVEPAGTVQPLAYDDTVEEWMITSNPLTVGNEMYRLILLSPVEAHLAGVGEILFAQRIQTFSLLAGTSLVTVILALFLSRNLRLDSEVKARTGELEQSTMLIGKQKRELEQANAQLKELDVLKDQFISIASHELKNPIQPILMYAELAKRGDVSWEKALDGIAVEAKRMKKLANDILDVSRIESGSLNYNFMRTKLRPIIDEIVSGARIRVPPEVRVEAEMTDNELEIDADGDRLAQVLENIISNSIKFTTRGSIRILVDSKDNSDSVVIKMSDTGSGIPEELLPTLFEKFVTKPVGYKNTNGTGLGLYISRAIVEAHGGKLSADNVPEGGAIFTISLPMHNSLTLTKGESMPASNLGHIQAMTGETN